MSNSRSDLFGPPPPRPTHDALNPNPLITLTALHTTEHFKLMSTGTVEELRLLGCQIIQSGVRMLKMSQASLYTAQILFNQFYARQSFLDFPLIDVVMASVFVAGKVEECIRRARDIVNVFHHIYCLIRSLPAHPIDYVGDTYYIWRDRLCTTEAHLLRELGFHVQPASPVGLLLSYMKILEVSDYVCEDGTVFAQVALNYLNDALKTNAYILFQPRIIATSAIASALDHLNLVKTLLPPVESLKFPWYALFDVNETELVECKKLIATIYNRELDTLLPLTKEELTIFATSIRPEDDRRDSKREHCIDDRREPFRDDAREAARDDRRETHRYDRRDNYKSHHSSHHSSHHNSQSSHHNSQSSHNSTRPRSHSRDPDRNYTSINHRYSQRD